MRVAFKKTALLAVLMVAVLFSQQVFVSFAANTESSNIENKTEEQWKEAHEKNPVHIFPSLKRIASSGEFSYEISYGLTSDKFKLTNKATSTTISTESAGDVNSPTKNFKITLYEKSGLAYVNKKAKAFCINGYDSGKWSSLTPGSTYYFEMSAGGTYVKGKGSISNFKEVV